MKKILILGFVFSLFAIAASAQTDGNIRSRHHAEMQQFQHGHSNRFERRHFHNREFRHHMSHRAYRHRFARVHDRREFYRRHVI